MNRISKINLSTSVYTYTVNIRDGEEQLILFVNKIWAQPNLTLIRNFFVSFYSQSETTNHILRLSETLKIFPENLDIVALLTKQNPDLIYAAGQNNFYVGIIRDQHAHKLINGNQPIKTISGWTKADDILFCLVGETANQTDSLLNKLEVKFVQHADTNVDLLRSSVGIKSGLIGGIVNLGDKEEKISNEFQSTLTVSKLISGSVPSFNPSNLIDDLNKNLQLIKAIIYKKIFTVAGFIGIFAQWLNKVIPATETIYAIESRKISEIVRSRNRKMLLSLATLLLIGLTVSIGYGIQKRHRIQWQVQFGQLLEDAEHKLNESKNLADLNPDRARDLASEVKTIINKLQERKFDPEQISSLQQQVGEVLGLTSGNIETETTTWLRLGLIRSDMTADDMRIYEDKLAVLDRSTDRAVIIGLSDKSAKVIAGKEQIGEGEQIAIYDNNIYVYSDKGIVSLSNEGASDISASDKEWGKVIDLDLFAGNVYMSTSTGIWKYPVIESGFGGKQAWLADDTAQTVDGTAMAIDGFVWIASHNKLQKFARGVEDSFNISGLEEDFSDIRALYTDENSFLIYVLEPSKNRIVGIDKTTGKYKYQYISKEFATATSLVVVESDKKMFILARDKILEAKLH